MAEAIRKISIQRGYDPREYVICAFGGAGGQHACAVADAVGSRSVLLHPLAGVLSAWGMGLADVRAVRELSVEQALGVDLSERRDALTTQSSEALAARGVTQLDGIVLDIGVSSMQLDQAERGFSFMKDGPLDMRMGGDGPSAADVVNSYEPRDLKRIFAILGEEKRAFNIARGIVKAREVEPIIRTRQLALIIEKSYGFVKPGSIHPATRSFQALRIHVNGELDELALALQAAEKLLKPGGRLVVVTFHSLEDRIVKKFLMERAGKSGRPSRHQMADEGLPPSFSLSHSGHIGPTDAETAVNPRSRSAKLRAGIRTDASPHPFSMEALGVPSLEAA
jgi:16S rRNA (cytosine1402-N4)-methyltransferase